MSKKKHTVKKLQFNTPLFENTVVVTKGTGEQLEQFVADEYGCDESLIGEQQMAASLTFYCDGHPLHILFFREDAEEANTPQVIAHECVHLAIRIMEHHAICNPTDDSVQEVFCLLVEHLVAQVTEALRSPTS